MNIHGKNADSKILSMLGSIIPKKENLASISKSEEEISKKEVTELLPKAQYCYQYWASALDEKVIKQSNKLCVDLHGQLHGINHHFILSPYPEHMNQKFMGLDLTPREMITQTDMEFKELKPTTEKMRVFRCIGEKPEFFSDYPQYLKLLDVKKGDVINMKEYAYATSDINYANTYLPNGRGVTYDIEIPSGARVSRTGDIGNLDEVVFPRSSKFECLNTERIKDGDNDYLLVKLRYILPDEPWRNPNYPKLD